MLSRVRDEQPTHTIWQVIQRAEPSEMIPSHLYILHMARCFPRKKMEKQPSIPMTIRVVESRSRVHDSSNIMSPEDMKSSMRVERW